MAGIYRLIKAVIEIAKLLIRRIGGGADTDSLTTKANDVIMGQTFIGTGSDEPQSGTMMNHGIPSYTMPINGSIKLPEGYYAGGTISQKIATMGAQAIGPGSKLITVQTSGKYMTGNVTINPVKNLTPANIKKGEYVGGVGPGLWEGYINTDPKVPYYYGSFNGIQSITSFKYKKYDNAGTVTLNKDSIGVYVKNNTYFTAIVFNSPIDVTNLKKLTVRMESSGGEDHNLSYIQSISLYRNKVTDYIWDNSTSKLKINPNIGAQVGGMNTSGTGGDFVLNVSSMTGKVYVYLFLVTPDANTKIYIVKFE